MPRFVAEVAFPARAFRGSETLTYEVENDVVVGEAVLAAVGPRKLIGYVVRREEVDEDHDFGYSVKKIDLRVHGASLPAELMETVTRQAPLCVARVGEFLDHCSPQGVEKLIGYSVELLTSVSSQPTTIFEEEALAAVRDVAPERIALSSFPEYLQRSIYTLAAKGYIQISAWIQAPKDPKSATERYRLTNEADLVSGVLQDHRKSPAQALAVRWLLEAREDALRQAEIAALCGVSEATIRALVRRKVLVKYESRREPASQGVINLRTQQARAIGSIESAVTARHSRTFLLHGVTGSGKTEVYLRAIEAALRQGRTALYLVPEIGLTLPAIAQASSKFGEQVAVVHSKLSPSTRLSAWIDIQRGAKSVVIGARSAIFAPLRNVGLIVIDEEHDSSYKQEALPFYHAIDLASDLAQAHRCPLVLGSATPRIETRYRVRTQEIEELLMPERVNTKPLPSVTTVSLAGVATTSLLSEPLRAGLADRLEKGQQSILFLNRKSYAPTLVCRDCGHRVSCPACSVTLNWYLSKRQLRCHQCDRIEKPVERCPECESVRIRPLGVGIERLEETVREEFPAARVARIDRTSVSATEEFGRVLSAFAEGDIDILIGTQMIAKGFHFKGVTLVGVVSCDQSLAVPDFRASERTLQLLSQVGGRAGRGEHAGQVILQGFDVEHPAIRAVAEGKFEEFFEASLEERKRANYPPYVRIARVVVRGEDKRLVQETIGKAFEIAGAALPNATLIGPTSCELERVRNQWRFHLIIKLSLTRTFAPLIALRDAKWPSGVHVSVSVDPYDFR